MKKVYVNDKCLYLTDYQSRVVPSPSLLSMAYSGHDTIQHVINTFSKSKVYTAAEIFHPNFEELWDDFNEYFEMINAAGGLVLDENNRLLVIYRHNKWDLPKGKVEDKELPEHAAVREVQEECGLAFCEIIKPLPYTYHTYSLNNKQILKRTWWYLMRSNSNEVLKPQAEEGITELKWIIRNQLSEVYKNTFASIEALLKEEEESVFGRVE